MNTAQISQARTVFFCASSGSVNTSCLFLGRGADVKIDARFLRFTEELGDSYSHKRFEVKICTTDGGTSTSIRSAFGIEEDIDPNKLYAILAYLSGSGFDLLTIPDREEEVNIIIGFTDDIVYYVEHEFEDGVREIHLHARPATRPWDDDKPLICIF